MEWISTKDMKNENAPDGQVLVQYLEPFMGIFTIEFAIGYFDNPNDYEDDNGDGWLHWVTDNKINVIAYAELPEKIDSEFSGIGQIEFVEKFNDKHPNLGCIGK